MMRSVRGPALVLAVTAALVGCGAGADTGFLRLQQVTSHSGYMSYNPAATDRWCLFPGPTGFKPPSAAYPDQLVRFVYRSNDTLPALPAGEPGWPQGSRRLAAAVTKMPASGTTQPSGVESLPLKMQPYGVGRYKLEQQVTSAGPYEEVGALIVEPFQGETRQHWFLFEGTMNPAGNQAPYREPSAEQPDVTTRFVYVSDQVYSVDLSAFQASLGWAGGVAYRRVIVTVDNF